MRFLIVTFLFSFLLFSPVLSFAVTCVETITQGTTDTCDAITKGNITWTLDTNYEVGQFVSGDFFVICSSGCTVSNITAGGGESLGGTMKNPSIIRNSSTNQQGYASSAPLYDAALDIGTSEAVVAGDMLISVTTRVPDTDITYVNEAAILTVLASEPASGSFRPGLADTSRTIYNESAIDWNLVSNLTPTASVLSLSAASDMVARPWIDHVYGWQGRQIHPLNNMRDYGGNISTDVAVVALMINTDFTQSEKEPMVYGLIQIGLDFWSIAKEEPYFYAAQPAHLLGRKLPVILAAELLDISEIKAIYTKWGAYGVSQDTGYPADAYCFSLDNHRYVDQYIIDNATGYTAGMMGMPEYFKTPDGNYGADDTSDWAGYTYRTCCSSGGTAGTQLAVFIMDLVDEWNAPAFMDYIDRYQAIALGEDDGWTVANESTGMRNGNRTGGEYTIEMWDEYRDDYPLAPGGSMQSGTGSVERVAEGGGSFQ